MGLLTRRHTRDLRNHNFDLREGWGVRQFYVTLNHATWIAQNGLSLQGIAFAAAQDMMTGMLTHGLTPPIYHQTAYASLRNPVFCLRQTAIWLIWHNTKPRVLDSTNWTLHDAHLTFHDISWLMPFLWHFCAQPRRPTRHLGAASCGRRQTISELSRPRTKGSKGKVPKLPSKAQLCQCFHRAGQRGQRRTRRTRQTQKSVRTLWEKIRV